jgi:prophage tail gpP-like protein
LHPSTVDTAKANNVKSWEIARSGREVYASYSFNGTSANTPNAYGANSHHDLSATGTAGLDRRKIVCGAGQNRAQARAELERDIQERAFGAEVLNYTVQGHAQDGRLWQIDSLVAVDDQINGVQGSYYLTLRRFVGSRSGGQVTELTLHPKGVLLP